MELLRQFQTESVAERQRRRALKEKKKQLDWLNQCDLGRCLKAGHYPHISIDHNIWYQVERVQLDEPTRLIKARQLNPYYSMLSFINTWVDGPDLKPTPFGEPKIYDSEARKR